MKATIVIPNINGQGWLRDSIESIYAQTEQDFRLIVVDNGSTDEPGTSPQLLRPPQLHPDRKWLQHGFFPRSKPGHRLSGQRVRGVVQQRRLC